MTEVLLLVSGRSGRGGQHSLKLFFFPKAMLNEVVTQTKLKHKLISKVKTQIELTYTDHHSNINTVEVPCSQTGGTQRQGRTGWDMQLDVCTNTHHNTSQYPEYTHETVHIEPLTLTDSVPEFEIAIGLTNVPQNTVWSQNIKTEHV